MSNLPALPNQRDIAEMARLRAIMDGTNVPAVQRPVQGHYAGGSAGVRRPVTETRQYQAPIIPSMSATREDVNAMKSLLETISLLSGEEEAAPVRQSANQPVALLETSAFSGGGAAGINGGPYEVLISLKENAQGKEIKSFNVVDSGRRDVVSGLVIQEAAQAIMKFMNKGQALDSSKVQEVLELEEDYNRSRIEAGRHKVRYQRAIELGESAAADVFKTRFGTAKANALAVQDQIKSIFDSIR